MKTFLLSIFFLALGVVSLQAQQKDSIHNTLDNIKVVSKDTLRQAVITSKDSINTIKTDTSKKSIRIFRKVNQWSSPKKAAMLSLVLPGAGQIYNKQGLWWRLPLVYGAYAGTIYTHFFYRKEYFYFKKIYELRVNKQPLPEKLYNRTVPAGYANVDVSALFRQKNYYRNFYERSFIWMGLAHIYGIADAYVTAHLKSFDMTDDISMKIKPKFDFATQRPMIGIAFQLK